MRFYIDQDNGTVNTSQIDGSQIESVNARLYEDKPLEVFFTRDAQVIRNTTPALDLLLARDAGENPYDSGRINVALTFTETSEVNDLGDTEYFWIANQSFSQPIYEKLLGCDYTAQKEIVTVQTVADVDSSSAGTFFDIYSGPTTYTRVWMDPAGVGDPPAASGPTLLYQVTYSVDATASTIATAIAAAFASNSDTAWEVGAVGDLLTFTAKSFDTRGWHSPRNSNFTMTLDVCGMSAFSLTDIASGTVLAQFVYSVSGAQQATQLFRFELENTLVRPGVVGAGIPTGRSRSGVVAIGSGVSQVAVTFSQPLPVSNYQIYAFVRNGTDASALVIAVGTVFEQETVGFSLNLTGDTDTANYELVYFCGH